MLDNCANEQWRKKERTAAGVNLHNFDSVDCTTSTRWFAEVGAECKVGGGAVDDKERTGISCSIRRFSVHKDLLQKTFRGVGRLIPNDLLTEG